MSYLIDLRFCFFNDLGSKLFTPEINRAMLLFSSGQITNEVEVDGVLINSIMESFLSKNFFLENVTSPVYSQIRVRAGMSSVAFTIKP